MESMLQRSTLGRAAVLATGILEPLIFSLFQANLVKKCYVIDVKIRQDMCTVYINLVMRKYEHM